MVIPNVVIPVIPNVVIPETIVPNVVIPETILGPSSCSLSHWKRKVNIITLWHLLG